ncbi:putative GTP-binding protein EngB [Frankliniella fusca]|uniref:GTP-binding protein EngB n=1 Tax=Frankliniella fusca TaxID=407009 RepID=A0AAE1HFW6_9NEOP|nr:putative GTP-binding protein EngB [Frankliniella fusca]
MWVQYHKHSRLSLIMFMLQLQCPHDLQFLSLAIYHSYRDIQLATCYHKINQSLHIVSSSKIVLKTEYGTTNMIGRH